MGLPGINIDFFEKMAKAFQLGQRGIVALILKDDTNSTDTFIYKSIDEVKTEDWTADNLDYIKKTFLESPSKIIVERIATIDLDYNAALVRLKNKIWNYLSIPGIAAGDVSAISTWIKDCRDNDKKTFKAILPNSVSDHEGIINFATDNIKTADKTYTVGEYTCRIAGILAGLPFTRSSTYYVLSEIESITESTDPNTDIDNGKLILINDGTKIKIGRGVNSLTTTTDIKGDSFKKIKIIEILDLIRDSIRATWEDEYVGKFNNSYDNKCLLISAINAFFKGLQKDGILDTNSAAKSEIDIEAQKIYLQSKGVTIEQLTEQEIKEYNTSSKVFLSGKCKPLDSMEDLDFGIYL